MATLPALTSEVRQAPFENLHIRPADVGRLPETALSLRRLVGEDVAVIRPMSADFSRPALRKPLCGPSLSLHLWHLHLLSRGWPSQTSSKGWPHACNAEWGHFSCNRFVSASRLARADLNRRPLPCQGSALPLSYEPTGQLLGLSFVSEARASRR